ncbi:MAG: oligosaccharide repeat unit polymerase [Bacteroidia bacterium]|nr:oligosaccharide repeat unit polymerase [Bacteroidia bacterium]
MPLLILFIVLLFLLLLNKKNKFSIFLIAIQILSITSAVIIGKDYFIEDYFQVFNLLFTFTILSLIILPWRNVKSIEEIDDLDYYKIVRLTKILFYISIIPFFVFSFITIIVNTTIDDINNFKYAEGISTDFYYSLPININFLIISTFLNYVSYFFIPLHFYFLNKKKYWLAFFCFLFSLNLILYGTSFFSRSVFIHYILIYISLLILFYGLLNSDLKKRIKRITILLCGIFLVYFSYVSNKRFEDDQNYADTIPKESIIRDPVNYGYLDYSSQWYANNMIVLNDYRFEGFNGQITFQSVLTLLGQYGVIPYDSKEYQRLRQDLWPEHWYTFNGFVSYSVYDYGYILTLILCVIYYRYINRNFTNKSKFNINEMIIIAFLIQIPLMAIFYSNVASLVFPIIFYIPVYRYLKKA